MTTREIIKEFAKIGKESNERTFLQMGNGVYVEIDGDAAVINVLSDKEFSEIMKSEDVLAMFAG